MFRPWVVLSALRNLILGAVLLAIPSVVAAQHHGGHGLGGSSAGSSRPDGVDEKDTLKDFHQAMAVQATSQQIAEFREVVKNTNEAADKLHSFVEESGKAGREGPASVEQAIENARAATRKFQQGFSEPQKAGLKETTKRLEKADSDLEQETRRLDQIVQTEAAKAELSARADSLGKALTAFSSLQLSLGREMGITLASAQDLSFNLPGARSEANVAGRKITVGSSGVLTQTAAQGDLRTFRIEMSADLSDLQQRSTEIMSAELNEKNQCGERLEVRRATIASAEPASSLILQLHFERWMCTRTFGQNTANELAESDGTTELRLTPGVEKSNAVTLTADFKRIDASGMLEEELRTGDLGADLRERVAKTVLSVVQVGADFKTALPGAAQGGATLQSARFRGLAAGILSIALVGQVQLSGEQVNALASQLNQTLSAQGNP